MTVTEKHRVLTIEVVSTNVYGGEMRADNTDSRDIEVKQIPEKMIVGTSRNKEVPDNVWVAKMPEDAYMTPALLRELATHMEEMS